MSKLTPEREAEIRASFSKIAEGAKLYHHEVIILDLLATLDECQVERDGARAAMEDRDNLHAGQAEEWNATRMRLVAERDALLLACREMTTTLNSYAVGAQGYEYSTSDAIATLASTRKLLSDAGVSLE